MPVANEEDERVALIDWSDLQKHNHFSVSSKDKDKDKQMSVNACIEVHAITILRPSLSEWCMQGRENQ